MKISTKGRYAVRIMLDLSRHSKEAPVHVAEIFEREGISADYAENILRSLKKRGLVISIKGPGGGYKLGKEPGEITIKEVISASEGKIALVNCVLDKDFCDRTGDCIARLLWTRVSEKIDEFLEAITIEDLLIEEQRVKKDKITEEEAWQLLLNVCETIKEMLFSIHQGFIKHSQGMLSKARSLGIKIDKRSLEVARLLEKSKLGSLLLIPCGFERIGDSLESISYSLRTKIEKDIFLSKDAVYEIETLFEKVGMLLDSFIACLRDKDKKKADIICKERDKSIKLLNRYAILHEKRTTSGLCKHVPAPIYMDILDSFKTIFNHLFKMAERVSNFDSSGIEEP